MALDRRAVAAPQCGEQAHLVSVAETLPFTRDAEKLLTEAELADMIQELATLRQLGVVIQDAGGLRKFRWGSKGKGKRGGVRVVYYYGGDHMPIFLLAIYGKNEKSDMSNSEKKAARKLVEALREEYKLKRRVQQLRVVREKGR